MKVDVKIAGASYSEVPSILLPLTAGGKARFCEVSDTTAVAGDVTKGKKFYTADGELVEGTASGSAGDSRKSITVIQKEHQTLTISCNHPDLSSSTDASCNTVYKTEYQSTVSISLQSDSDYNAGKITVNGVEQESSGSSTQSAYATVDITDGMVISATDAVVIPTIPFTDVGMTLKGQGSQLFFGYILKTENQSPDTPKIEGILLIGNGDTKGMILVVDAHYASCTVSITTDTGISETIQIAYEKDTDFGNVMVGALPDILYEYLKGCATDNAEVTLNIKVVS